ncbi:MAG: ATP-binding cassette domain-containing protein [Thermoguttaceae bacterium]|nr:ATP-binding cassette domain-containing protein [Thermoguttaceae bacterium]
MTSLSGGELQKVAIGRIFAQEPRLLLLDEPTSALDLKNRGEIIDLLREYAVKRGAAVLTSIHDLNDAFALADRMVALKNGHVLTDVATAAIGERELSELYDTPLEIFSRDGARIATRKSQWETNNGKR